MKEAIALTVLLLLAISTLILAAKKRVGVGVAAVLLCSALIAGWLVSYHDWLNAIGIGNSTATVDGHNNGGAGNQGRGATKPALTLTDIQTMLETQQKSLDALTETNGIIRERLNAGDQQLKELQESLDQVKREAAALRAHSSEIALMMVRIAWLQLEAMDDSEAERADMAVRRILDEMDAVMKLTIEDPVTRARFVDDVKKVLPPKP